MRNELISIIIPIYNVEKYLEKCINSILNQTYKKIEIILVDDGSTDFSGKIIDQYLEKDDRIRVYHKKNGGLSDARNYGIKKSSGKYITFVDSDDYVEENYIESLYNQICVNNVDMAVGSMTIVNGNKKKKININKKIEKLSKNEALKRMLLEEGYGVSANAKMYLRELFDDIEYPVDKLYEDNGVTYKLIMKCDNISVSSEGIYYYVMRKGSIINEKFTMRKLDYINLTDESCNHIEQKIPELKDVCTIRRVIPRLSIIRQMLNTSLNEKEKKEFNKIYKYLKTNYKNIMKNKNCNKKIKISLKLLMTNKIIFKIGANIYEKIK